MKLFGNKKRRPAQKRPQQTQELRQPSQRMQPADEYRQPVQRTQPAEDYRRTSQRSQPPAEEQEEGRLSGKTKAWLLLAASVCVFLCAVIMCLSLIQKSAEPVELPQLDDPKQLQYVVNSVKPSTVEMPTEAVAPVSRNDSETLNVLLLTRNGDNRRTDAVLLASVDMETGELALLSFPRDTYVAGNYETPKLSLVYQEADDGKMRGIQAVWEKVANMVGFTPDYYFVLDEASMTAMTGIVGGVNFTVPDSPNYSTLSGGLQRMDGVKAMQLLCYREGYTDVETEPARVQREFLLTLLDALLSDPQTYLENAETIAAAADTDLSAGNLAYLAYLLQNTDVKSAFSRALPGGEIEIDGELFYEVNPEKAIELLNEHFNPNEKALTVYDVSFRQETGDSGSGTYDPYGFSSSTEEPRDPDNDPTDNTDDTEDTEDTQDTENTDNTDETTAPTEGPEPSPEPTDPPTEPAPPEEP